MVSNSIEQLYKKTFEQLYKKHACFQSDRSFQLDCGTVERKVGLMLMI